MALATHKVNERLQRERKDESQCSLVWTINMEEMLIYYVRANRILWDPSHPSFHKMLQKKRKIEDIATHLRREVSPHEAFAVTAENIWMKFRSMRLFFLREVKKVHDSRSNIGDDGYTSSWAHYNRMRFLLHALRPKENQNKDHPRHISISGSYVDTRNPETRISSTFENDGLMRCEASSSSQSRVANEEGTSLRTPATVQLNVDTTEVTKSQEATSVQNTRPKIRSTSNSRYKAECHQQKRRRTDILEKIVDSLQNERRDSSDIAGTFGKFVAASVRELPVEKQHAVMSSITQVLSEFHKSDA